MGKNNGLAGRIAAAAGGRAPAADAPPASTSAHAHVRTSASAHVRTDRVKVSVAFDPLEYRDLGALQRQVQEHSGIVRVTNRDLIRHLVAMASEDADLAERLVNRMRAPGATRWG